MFVPLPAYRGIPHVVRCGLCALALALMARLPLEAQVQIDPPSTFRRGDVNVDAVVDLSDGVALLGCLFLGTPCPTCPDAADSNDDGIVELSDSIYLFNWLFLGGPDIAAPGPFVCGPDPTTDALGFCRYDLDGCGPVVQDPRLADAISRLHYAARVVPSESDPGDFDAGDYDVNGPRFEEIPREFPYRPRSQSPAWNSTSGRESLLAGIGHSASDFEWERARDPISIEGEIAAATDVTCVRPRFYAGNEVLQWDDYPGGPLRVMSPDRAFSSRAEARAFLERIHAEMPFFLPFRHPDVVLGQGWFYNNGNGHRGQDYSRRDIPEDEDPTFAVLAVGAGEVVYKTYRANGGNIVVVEHTAPGGQKVFSMYMHLRNGRARDVRAARAITDTSARCEKYKAFARNFPNHISWGTDEHEILVDVGDTVAPLQQIGWAGNTGCGGAGGGLKDPSELDEGELEGQPFNWRGNTHLHTYWAVPHPATANVWVFVDPYGVYEEASTGCYELLKDTEFSRLIAPFYPTFHGVPYEVFEGYWGYYRNMGWTPRTLSFHKLGAQPLVSGSFQPNIPGNWRFEFLRTFPDFEAQAVLYYLQGFIPRETTVVKTTSGQVLHNAIFREILAGEAVDYPADAPIAEYESFWQRRVVQQGWRIEDYVGYDDRGNERITALATNAPPTRPHLFYRNRTSAEMQDVIDGDAHEGLILDSFSVAELSFGTRFNAVFRDIPSPVPQCWRVEWGMTPAQYQAIATQNFADGFRLQKIQAYANTAFYAALFYRAGPGACE